MDAVQYDDGTIEVIIPFVSTASHGYLMVEEYIVTMVGYEPTPWSWIEQRGGKMVWLLEEDVDALQFTKIFEKEANVTVKRKYQYE